MSFTTSASNLAVSDFNSTFDIVVAELTTGRYQVASTTPPQLQANDISQQPTISADGRYVAFKSAASNLVQGDTNNQFDIFVKDSLTGHVQRVAADVHGDFRFPQFSADGHYLVYTPRPSQFSGPSVIVTDISGPYPGLSYRIEGSSPSVNANGHLVAYVKSTGPQNQTSVYIKDIVLGIIPPTFPPAEPMALGTTKFVALGDSPSISANGQYVAFRSSASNLVPNDTNGVEDIFVYNTQTESIVRASYDIVGMQANAASSSPKISSDGRYVAFESFATNLTTGDSNGKRDVFVKDIFNSSIPIKRASTNWSNIEADSDSFLTSISLDGRFVTFQSDASNVVANDTNGVTDVFIKDLQAVSTAQSPNVTRVSTSSSNNQSNGSSEGGSVSSDGRYVAYLSTADNLVSGDSNLTNDIFLKDVQTGLVTLMSTRLYFAARQSSNGYSRSSSLSEDGRFVVFQSSADNLVLGDVNGIADIFVSDSSSGVVTRVNTNSFGADSNDTSEGPSISSNGRYVAFMSYASNLVDDDSNGTPDVFVKDTWFGNTTRVSTELDGTQRQWYSYYPSISANGRYVSFMAQSATGFSVFVKDLQTLTIVEASTDSSGGPIGGDYAYFDVRGDNISPDGRYVSFHGRRNDEAGTVDYFLKDLTNGNLSQINTNELGTPFPSGGNAWLEMSLGGPMSVSNLIINEDNSESGPFVAFATRNSNILGGNNNLNDVFVKNMTSHEITQVNTDANGVEANGISRDASISSNGRYVAFSSSATNLVPGDTNNTSDIFVKDILTGAIWRLNTVPGGGQSTVASYGPRISADGRFVTFESFSDSFYSGDTNSTFDVFRVSVPIDTDEVDDSVENTAPNAGDGNSDGFQDSVQNNVTSLPNGNDEQYITLESPVGTSLASVAPIDNPSPADSPAGVEFPFGHLNFAIENAGVGLATTVTLYLPDDTVVNNYFKFGPTPDNATPHWYEFLFDGFTGAAIPADVSAGPDVDSDPEIIVLHFIDGGRGDDDLLANGQIIDPGSPAFVPDRPPVANASGPYVTAEGANLQLDARASFDQQTGTTLTYEWDLNYDGFVFSTDAFGVQPNVKFGDNFNSRFIGLRVTNSLGLSSHTISTVESTNVAPQNVNAGIDRIVFEGSTVMLAGTFTDPGVLDTHTQNGSVISSNGQVVVTGNGPNFSFIPNDNGTYTVTYTVTDDDGGSTFDTALITVKNAAPVIVSLNSSAATTATGSINGFVSLSGVFSDAGSRDTHRVIVLWGDGSLAETLTSVNPLTRSFSGGHTYSNSGVYTISVSVVDSDGTVSVKQDKTAVVGGIGVLNGTLYVIGTNGKDEVDIKLKSNGNAGQVVNVKGQFDKNGTKKQFDLDFTPTTIQHIVIMLGDSDDDAKVNTNILVGALIDGGAGNDRLRGGGGDDTLIGGPGRDELKGSDGDDVLDGGADDDNLFGGKGFDVLLGGDGNDDLKGGGSGGDDGATDGGGKGDILVGGSGNDNLKGTDGRNILIGGVGKDDLTGGAGDDLLIGGSTYYDTHVESLRLIMAEWNSARSYENRMVNLRTSAGPVLGGTGVRLTTSGMDRTVVEDTDKDTLKGGADRDWYFADLMWDELKDKKSNEILN